MIEYKIIWAQSIEDLAVRVSAALNQHWSCVGGVMSAATGNRLLGDGFYQAVQKGSAGPNE